MRDLLEGSLQVQLWLRTAEILITTTTPSSGRQVRMPLALTMNSSQCTRLAWKVSSVGSGLPLARKIFKLPLGCKNNWSIGQHFGRNFLICQWTAVKDAVTQYPHAHQKMITFLATS